MTTTIDDIAIGQELPTLAKDVSQRRIDADSTVRAALDSHRRRVGRAKGFKAPSRRA